MRIHLTIATTLVLAVGCGCAGDPDLDCADVATVRSCDGDDCELIGCRGDEVCQGGGCVAFTDADLWADFELRVDERFGRRVICEVDPGGFPRTQVESLRFTFGDGTSGYSELISHTYDEPGVYPVDLEVRLVGYRILRASRMAVIESPPPHNPLVLTVNRIPDYLNGSVPYVSDEGTANPSDDTTHPFHLQLPRHGFTVDVELRADPADPVQLASLSLTADQALGTAAAGAELAGQLVFDTHERHRVRRAQWIVPDTMAATPGIVTFTLGGVTQSAGAHTRSVTAEVIELTPALDPLDRPMGWLFRFELDFYSAFVNNTGGGIELTHAQGGNAEPDFLEDLAAFGAQGIDTAPGARTVRGRGQVGANAIYARWIYERIVEESYRYYGMAADGTPHDGIAFTIYIEGDPGAPAASSYSDTGDFSMMRFGGAFNGFLGFSQFAIYNEGRVNDSTPSLGVGTGGILAPLIATPGLTEEFDPLKPATGSPVGTHAEDAVVLAAGFDRWDRSNSPAANARYDILARIARFMGLAIGAVTAHEMGHAMGLMPDGAPPDGFFGDRGDVTFIGAGRTNSHHADFPGLNLMQAGGNLLGLLGDAFAVIEVPRDYSLVQLAELLALENRLSPYSRAYMQRRLTYADFNGKRGRQDIVGCW